MSPSPSPSPLSIFTPFTRRRFPSTSSSRRPRPGYISYLLTKLQRLLRDLWRYARRHPVRFVLAVVVPLLSAAGAVAGLLRALGVGAGVAGVLEKMVGGNGRKAGGGGGGYYGSRGYGGVDVGGTVGALGQIARIAGSMM